LTEVPSEETVPEEAAEEAVVVEIVARYVLFRQKTVDEKIGQMVEAPVAAAEGAGLKVEAVE
jgi:hypothetical protein